ncbi:MAG: translocation/assembly module TamB domain-containing protein [Pseudomonadota bacterium]
MRRAGCILAATLWALPVAAQTPETAEGADDNGFIIRLLQDQLSTESRKIRLSGVDGVLSSAATVDRITISDREGIWLQIDGALIDWNRSALLRGRVEVETLAAERISIPRLPVPEPGIQDPSAGGFSIPDLPVSIELGALEVDRIELGEPVLGLEAVFNAEGSMRFDDATLEAALRMIRVDGAGGRLALEALVGGADETVDVSLNVSEPEGGVFAGLLGLDDRPPLETRIRAEGSFADLAAEVDFVADGQDLLDGTLNYGVTDGDARFSAELTGRLQPLIPADFHDFFAEQSTLRADGTRSAAGRLVLERLDIDSGGLSVRGSAATAPDGFVTALDLSADLRDPDGSRLTLPVPGAETSIAAGALRLSYGGQEEWTGSLSLESLDAGTLSVADVAVDMGGLAQGLNDPATRRVTARITGAARGLNARDPGVDAALGDRITLDVETEWSEGEPIDLQRFALDGGPVALTASGLYSALGFRGQAEVAAQDISVFGAVTGRDLAGGIAAAVIGQVDPVTGAFDLTVDGTADDLRLDQANIDPLLTGQTRLSGRLARDEEGLRAEAFGVANDQLSVLLDGSFGAQLTDLDLTGDLTDIGLVTDAASGAVSLSARADGSLDALRLNADLSLPTGTLKGREVANLGLSVEAEGSDLENLRGSLLGRAGFGDTPVRLDGDFALEGDVQRLRQFIFSAGPTQARGNLVRGADGRVAGTVSLDTTEIEEAAALFLLDATGAADLQVTLSRDRGEQRAAIVGTVRDLAAQGVELGAADLDLVVGDLFGVPLAAGRAEIREVLANGIGIDRIAVRATRAGSQMDARVEVALPDDIAATAEGRLTNLDPGLQAYLSALRVTARGAEAALQAPATLRVQAGAIALEGLDLTVEGGRLRADAEVTENLDVALAIEALPLGFANRFVPDLGANGVLNGTATVSGSLESPQVDFALSGAGVTVAAIAETGIPPLDVAAQGRSVDRAVEATATLTAGDAVDISAQAVVPLDPEASGLRADLTVDALSLALFDPLAGGQGLAGSITATASVGGSLAAPTVTFSADGVGITADAVPLALDVQAEGETNGESVTAQVIARSGDAVALTAEATVPLDPQAEGLAGEVEIQRLTLAPFDRHAGNQGLTGTVTGSASVTGRVAAPEVRFEAAARGLSAQPARQAGLGGVTADVTGGFADQVVNIERLSASSAGGLSISGSGAVPLAGDGLNVFVQGEAPLTLANVALASAQSQVAGRLAFNAQATGALTDPNLSGEVTVRNGRFVNQAANLRLERIRADIALAGDRITIVNARALPVEGGQIRLGGDITLDPARGIPGDLSIDIEDVVYTDGEIVTTEVVGALTVTGPLATGPLLAGEVTLIQTEVVVPSRFGLNEGVLLDIRHRAPPADVQLTLDRSGLTEENFDDGPGFDLGLDLLINAPNRQFIRGRGLDVEMGGSIRLRGSSQAVAPTGQIDLIRGRLGLLGQRIDFDQGSITLLGSLDPVILLVAETETANGTLVIVRIEGRATDPEVTFTSQPELPEDEVLALLLFDRNVSELSPFQIAQLAAAAASLAGRGGGGVVNGLRSAIGLSDLDITTDDDGDVGVRAGAYLDENIYLDVEADSAGDSKATVNLDITDSVTGRVSVDSNGESTIGIFFERDY